MGRFSRIVVAVLGGTLIALPALFVAAEPIAHAGDHALGPAFAATTLPIEPAAEPATKPEPFTERYSWLLPAIVVLATALIGAFIASIVREIHRRLPPPDPPD